MSTFEVVTTVSHRYYARKRKDEIILRIEELRRLVGEPAFSVAQFNEKRKLTCDQLAYEAMALHRRLPT